MLILADRLADVRADQARRRLHAFVQLFWPVVEPHARFVDNWHIGALCAHLEGITRGHYPPDVQTAVINIPPGCMKSYLVSVFWPVWEWIEEPSYRYLCGSYDDRLSIRDTRRSRDILKSEGYQRYWPLALSRDQDTKTRYDNVKSGWRMATSVGGAGTGEHPHRKIVDDPHNVKQSLSEVQREEANTWISLTLSTRGAALRAWLILIMQRLHEEDATAKVLATLGDRAVHICLPMRYEPPAWFDMAGRPELVPRMKPTPLGWQDPRTTAGELLWPALFPEAVVASTELQLRSALGEYGVAGQMQQRPAPESGGIFKRENLQIVDALPADAQILRRCRGWDAAATDGGGDWTAGVRVAIARDGMVYVEDVVRAQVGPGADEKLMKQTADTDGRRVEQREEQEGGSAGKKVIAAHGKALAGYIYTGEPVSKDKVTRAHPFAAQVTLGNVRLVRGAWNKAYIDELAMFPNGTHDDQVDGTSTAYNHIALKPQNIITPRKLTGF